MNGYGEQYNSKKEFNKNSNLSKEQILKLALKLHSEGKISEATKFYQYFLDKGFKDHRLFFNYGVLLNSIGKSQEADSIYRKAIAIKPDFPEAHYNLGAMLKDLGNLKEAELSYRKAIAIKPDFAEAHYNLGIILKDLGNLIEAENAFRKTIELNPNFANSHFLLGIIQSGQHNHQEAENAFRKTIELNPNFAEAHLNLGNVLKEISKLKEAELSQHKAIELNPNFANAHYNLGNILKEISKLKEAELSYRKAIELKPNFSEAHYNLGKILKEISKLREAELSLGKVIHLKPDLAEAHSNLGRIFSELGKLKEAEFSLRKAIELKPNIAATHLNLGVLLKEVGKSQEAEVFIRKSIELNPNLAEAHLIHGKILKDLGNLQEAELSTRKAIELKPTLPNAHQLLGSILLHKGSQELSLKCFSESAKLLRGEKNKESNHKRFTRISKAKIKHDVEQFEYLASQCYETEKFKSIANIYKKVATAIKWPSETKLIDLSNEHQNLLNNIYNRLIYQVEAPKLKEDVVNNSLNTEKITQNYFDHDFGLTYIDDFLSPLALDSLRKFLLGSTIWFDIKPTGWIGAYLGSGLANPLILQIADELSKKFPKIFKDYPIKQIWAYKYDSRAKEVDSSLSGIHVHADPAAVNVNFWITPNEANLNPKTGGMIVYDVEAPKDWSHESYNSDVKKIREEIKRNKAKSTVIPYKENRAVVFNSDLFHETDNYEFKEGYENRRINVTILFGDRTNG